MNIPGINCNAFVRYPGAFLLAVVLAGCGSGGGGSGGMGTVGVSITDAPACGFDAVNVTVRQIRIHRSSSAPDTAQGWADINLNPARKINLLELNNGVLEGLGEMPLGAGRYTQVRLVLVANSGGNVANSVVLSGTVAEIPVDTPSAVQSGIKLVHPFNVQANERTDLLLDFDACKSIVTRGNGSYALKPVIRVIPTALNGIRGVIAPSLPAANVVVSAQLNGEVVHSTVPNPLTGEFFLARFEPGAYDLVVTADGRATAVIMTVPVANSSSIAITSTVAQPITLSPSATNNTVSGTVTLSPVSPETVAFVAAKQMIDTGLTVTVKARAADLLSGAYSLTLPAEAPQLGSYGTGTLPITLVSMPTAAGQYIVEASADGYVTQSVAANLSSAGASRDFTLVP